MPCTCMVSLTLRFTCTWLTVREELRGREYPKKCVLSLQTLCNLTCNMYVLVCAHMCERRLWNMCSNTHSYIHILTVWSDSKIYFLYLRLSSYKVCLIHSQVICSGFITNKDLKEVWELLQSYNKRWRCLCVCRCPKFISIPSPVKLPIYKYITIHWVRTTEWS